jgi:haloacid dehalogenase-like hydrolase
MPWIAVFRLKLPAVGTPVEGVWQPISGPAVAAAFFDLDKTIISKSSTLAFGPSFYRHGLLSRTDVVRGGLAQLLFQLSGANHRRMEKIRERVSETCRGWPADRVIEIVTLNLESLILPYVYAEARALLSEHRGAGQDVIIVSTSGQEVVAPIGALLGVESVIATRMGSPMATTPARWSSTLTARSRPSRSESWPSSGATRCRTAMPTATRSPTCPCSR